MISSLDKCFPVLSNLKKNFGHLPLKVYRAWVMLEVGGHRLAQSWKTERLPHTAWWLFHARFSQAFKLQGDGLHDLKQLQIIAPAMILPGAFTKVGGVKGVVGCLPKSACSASSFSAFATA